MKHFLITFQLFFFCGLTWAQNDTAAYTLKDSLLQHYTIEELKQMTFNERRNVIRKLRGQESYPFETAPDYDRNGIRIVEDIPYESAENLIKIRVDKITNQKDNYRQEVFPNSYADVIEAVYGGLYKSFLTRELYDSNYQKHFNQIDSADTTMFSNFTKRTYFFNEENSLRLIILEVGYNINEGKGFYWADNLPYKYKKSSFYIWSDTLQYYHVVSAEQPTSEPSMIGKEEMDTLAVRCIEGQVYYYKNNGFYVMKREGEFQKERWREELRSVPFKKELKGSSIGVIWVRNFMQEFREYVKGENNYLEPVTSSFLQPFTIKRGENPK